MNFAPLLACAIALAFAPSALAAPLEARGSLRPETVFFGDPVTAEAEVVVDASVVEPSTVRIDFAAVPFRQLSAPEVERWEADGVTVVRERVRLVCASEACLPGPQGKKSAPQQIRVTARSRDGRALGIRVPWAPVEVVRRVPEEALNGEPIWHADDTPSMPTYRASPSLLSGGLFGIGIALALAAAALIGNEALRLRRRSTLVHRTPLEAALAAVRAALDENEPERRTAAGTLARVLADRDGRLVTAASELAWSGQPPVPERLTALADDVEREVGAR